MPTAEKRGADEAEEKAEAESKKQKTEEEEEQQPSKAASEAIAYLASFGFDGAPRASPRRLTVMHQAGSSARCDRPGCYSTCTIRRNFQTKYSLGARQEARFTLGVQHFPQLLRYLSGLKVSLSDYLPR